MNGMLEVFAQVFQPEVLVHFAGGVDPRGLASLGTAPTRAGGAHDIDHIVILSTILIK